MAVNTRSNQKSVYQNSFVNGISQPTGQGHFFPDNKGFHMMSVTLDSLKILDITEGRVFDNLLEIPFSGIIESRGGMWSSWIAIGFYSLEVVNYPGFPS
jgi:hypothetical protein